jgi:hypothetical protein
MGDARATLCEMFVESVPVSGASITVFRDPTVQSTICTSNELAASLDQLQFDLSEGPRWETARTGLVTVSHDLKRDVHPRWPVFGAAAAELGVGALFSFPIRIGGELMGVADLYRDEAGPLGNEATARAIEVSRRVALPAVDRAGRSAESALERPEDGAALRREVHQATGMVLMQLEVTAAEALAILRGYAFAHGRSVDDVARDVVARRIDFGEESPEGRRRP